MAICRMDCRPTGTVSPFERGSPIPTAPTALGSGMWPLAMASWHWCTLELMIYPKLWPICAEDAKSWLRCSVTHQTMPNGRKTWRCSTVRSADSNLRRKGWGRIEQRAHRCADIPLYASQYPSSAKSAQRSAMSSPVFYLRYWSENENMPFDADQAA